MTRHIADRRSQSDGGRVKHFLRLSRTPRETFHRAHAQGGGNRRLREFLRIERGRTA
jgi:hypothetical protein